MKHSFLLIMLMSFVSIPSLAESAAKKQRGGSCTDNCTVAGKRYVHETKLFSGVDVSEDERHRLCDIDDDDYPGNVYWCENNCLSEGGLWTKIMNKDRKKKVQEFVKERKATCSFVLEQMKKRR